MPAHSLRFVVICLAFTACTAAAPAGPRAPASIPAAQATGCDHSPPVQPGSNWRLVVAVDPAMQDGVHSRSAVVYVPLTYRSGRPAPLVMEFHGAAPNATAQGYEATSPLHRVADIDGFIDVFPQGLRAPNGNLAWNAYGPVYWHVAEIPFVQAVLRTVEARLCVDRTRVYASGISNGGNMVNYVACRDAAQFAAVAPVVGPMYGQDDGPCRPSRPVPIIDIHSLNDPAVPYAGLPGPPRFDFPLPSVDAWLAGWAQLDGCGGAPASMKLPGGQSVRTWSRCADGARIVAYATQAGHAWPATIGGAPVATVVWHFLNGFSLHLYLPRHRHG